MATSLQSLLTTYGSEEIYVLTKEGLSDLTKEIFKNVNTRIADRIVTSIDDCSDNDHTPSALTVKTALENVLYLKCLVVASGKPEDAAITPDTKTLYMVRKQNTDTTGALFVYLDNLGYINVSGTGDEDPDVVVNPIPSEDITNIVTESFNETDPGIGN